MPTLQIFSVCSRSAKKLVQNEVCALGSSAYSLGLSPYANLDIPLKPLSLKADARLVTLLRSYGQKATHVSIEIVGVAPYPQVHTASPLEMVSANMPNMRAMHVDRVHGHWLTTFFASTAPKLELLALGLGQGDTFRLGLGIRALSQLKKLRILKLFFMYEYPEDIEYPLLTEELVLSTGCLDLEELALPRCDLDSWASAGATILPRLIFLKFMSQNSSLSLEGTVLSMIHACPNIRTLWLLQVDSASIQDLDYTRFAQSRLDCLLVTDAAMHGNCTDLLPRRVNALLESSIQRLSGTALDLFGRESRPMSAWQLDQSDNAWNAFLISRFTSDERECWLEEVDDEREHQLEGSDGCVSDFSGNSSLYGSGYDDRDYGDFAYGWVF